MVTRVVLNPSKEKLEKLIYICEKFCFFFFLSRRFLNLHFDGVYSLALGKPAKVLQYLEDEESLQERRALRKCGTGYHECTFAFPPRRCCFVDRAAPSSGYQWWRRASFLRENWVCLYCVSLQNSGHVLTTGLSQCGWGVEATGKTHRPI